MAKTVAGSYMRVMIGDLMVWALKLDTNLHQNTIGKLSSRAFDGVIYAMALLSWNDT
jgi:hypothetical protein